MILEHKVGFYTLIHVPTGHFYFGSSVNLKRRIWAHAGSIGRGDHENPKLRGLGASWDDFKILASYCDDIDKARHWEKFYIDRYIGHPLCCNHATDPYSPMSNMTREGRSLGGKRLAGRKRSPGAIALTALATSKRVSVDGVEHAGMKIAAEALGVNVETARDRFNNKSSRFANWIIL